MPVAAGAAGHGAGNFGVPASKLGEYIPPTPVNVALANEACWGVKPVPSSSFCETIVCGVPVHNWFQPALAVSEA